MQVFWGRQKRVRNNIINVRFLLGSIMIINTTQLHANLYQVLDEILKTQKPVEIIRKGRKLKIILIQENQSK